MTHGGALGGGVLDGGVIALALALGLAALALPAVTWAASRGQRRRAVRLLRSAVCLLWLPGLLIAALGPWGLEALFFLVPVLTGLTLPAALLAAAGCWPRVTGLAGAAGYGAVGGAALIPLGLVNAAPQQATLQALWAALCFVIAAVHLGYAVGSVSSTGSTGAAASRAAAACGTAPAA